MADTAPVTLYRNELIAGFERGGSALRETCTTEGMVKGNQIVFDIVDSGGASAVTRGASGNIPARTDNNTQVTCTLEEWHDLAKKTNFNIFQSQGNQRAVMQDTTIKVMGRKADDQIITALNTGTLYAGLAAATLSLSKAMHAVSVVLSNNVPLDNNVNGLLTPAAFAYLMQVNEVTSKDFVTDTKMVNAPRMFMWAGIRWMVHTGLPGAGTNAETLFVYHKAAIGHGMDTGGMDVKMGYHDEQDYSWARCTGYMGAKLLQNAGVCKIRHDGSAYAATA